MATGSGGPSNLTELAGGIAHDLNNSLTSILSLTELVSATVGGQSPLASDLHEIDVQARRAAELVHRLLEATQRHSQAMAASAQIPPAPAVPSSQGLEAALSANGAKGADVEIPPSSKAPAPGVRQHTLLVADDEPSIRRLLARVLAAGGHLVHTVETGEEFATLLEKVGQTIDLALVDVRMPGRGGLEVYGDLRQRYPRMRVIFMSGYPATAEDYRRLYQWGATFLRKPFSIREVEQRVDALLSDTPHV